MLHWHGFKREDITEEALKKRHKEADYACPNNRCKLGPRMAARMMATASARRDGSWYNAAKDKKHG